MSKLRNLLFGAVAVASSFAAGIGTAQAQVTISDVNAASQLTKIQDEGVLRVGLGTFAPWAMRGTDGDLIGFEVEVARQLAEDAGWDVEFVPTAWDGIVPALLTGKFDVVIGGMEPTVPRSLQVNFTIPYGKFGFAAVANSNSKPGIETFDDVNTSGTTVVGFRGGSASAVMEELFPNATLVYFDDVAAIQQELLSGRADVFFGTLPRPFHMASDFPERLYKPFGNDVIRGGITSFGVRKGDPDFVAFLDNWIRLRSNDGWLQGRFDYWFGTTDWRDLVAAD